ncbi:MAG: SGNH/GDSL hydrolase family protein [Gemmatimonadaceae bacterium]
MNSTMGHHVALLGDSIFDNRSYTRGAPDVATHLKTLLRPPWRVSLCAVDGSTVADLAQQFSKVPGDVSHLMVSIGGNDALLNSDLLALPVSSTSEALALFGERVSRFEEAYRLAVESALALGLDTTICTIYNGNLDAAVAPLARIALMMFNDVILRVAVENSLRVIDLRQVCTDAPDYSNSIEPSGSGGRKIAVAIAKALGAVEGEVGHARVYAG